MHDTTNLSPKSWVEQVTVEHLLYGLIIVLGATIRLVQLDAIPLSPDEAAEAFSVWEFWQADSAYSNVGSPAYFTVTSLISNLAGFGDGVMRIGPALAGLSLLVLPILLRSFLGQRGALISSLLIALSPLLILNSRTVGGGSMAILSASLVVVGWLKYQETGQQSWIKIIIVAFAVALTTDPLAIAIIVTAALAWTTQRLIGPPLLSDQLGDPRPTRLPDSVALKPALIFGGAALVVVGTTFFLHPAGIAGIAEIGHAWISRFGPSDAPYSWTLPAVLLGRYELILLLVGIPSLIWATAEVRPVGSFFAYWLILSIALVMFQRANPQNLIALAIPGYLLIGRMADSLFDYDTGIMKWIIAAGILLSGAIVYVNLTRYLRLAPFSAQLIDSYNLILIALVLVATVAMLLLVRYWDVRLATQGLLLGSMLVLGVYTWGTGWWMATEGGADTRESWVFSASDDDLPLLGENIIEISGQVAASRTDLELVSTIDSPSLRWYLRTMKNLVFRDSLPPDLNSQALITEAAITPVSTASYVGSDFGHVRPDTSHDLAPREALSWWLFHQSSQTIPEERVTFWLRSDLTGRLP